MGSDFGEGFERDLLGGGKCGDEGKRGFQGGWVHEAPKFRVKDFAALAEVAAIRN